MHFRPFSLKKSDFSDFAYYWDFLTVFFDDLLNIVLLSPPPKTPDSPRVPHCLFELKIGKKSEKNRISEADPQKRISDS